MTNEQVTELLRGAQKYWKKWRDDVPDPDDSVRIDQMIHDANAPLEGMPEQAMKLMEFFTEELAARVRAKGGTT